MEDVHLITEEIPCSTSKYQFRDLKRWGTPRMCFQIHQMVVGIASNWPKFTGFNAFALPFPCKSSRKIQFMHCISLYIPHHPYVLQVAWLRTLSDHTIPTGATPSYKGLMQISTKKKHVFVSFQVIFKQTFTHLNFSLCFEDLFFTLLNLPIPCSTLRSVRDVPCLRVLHQSRHAPQRSLPCGFLSHCGI